MGVLITAAFGLSREWAERAACRTWRSDADVPSPWQFDPDQVVYLEREDGTKATLFGREMRQLALLSCRGCPVQYECATYAVDAKMVAGTWAMKIADLRWLQRQGDRAADIIAAAQLEGRPVQVAVRMARGLS